MKKSPLWLLVALLLSFCVAASAQNSPNYVGDEFWEGDYKYMILEDDTVAITRCNAKEPALVIPWAAGQSRRLIRIPSAATVQK